MFDAGEAAQMSFMRSGLGWNKKMRIFVTHLHGDHCIGLLGLLQTMSMQARTENLEIFGPPGIREFVECNTKSLNLRPAFLLPPQPVRDGTIVDHPEYCIRACAADHSVESYSYVFEEKPKPGRFVAKKALALKVPRGPLWGALQRGSEVEIDGRIVRPSQVLREPRRGMRIGISGDTRPSERLCDFFTGCDYLVFDSTFSDEDAPRAKTTMHSTAVEAAKLAHSAGARHLILTHFSARYPDVSLLVRQAEQFHDSVIAASDMQELELEVTARDYEVRA